MTSPDAKGETEMAKGQATITCCQMFNPKFDQNKKSDDFDNAKHVFKVERMTNTLEVHIGEYLRPARVQGLIDAGVNVTIQPVK